MTEAKTIENKRIIEKLYKEVLFDWNMPVVNELVAPGFFSHDWPVDIPKGPEAFKRYYSETILSVLPDARYIVDDLVAENDRVVVRWRLIGTHKGTFENIEPTGEQLCLNGIAIYRLENQLLQERWVVTDLYGLLQLLKKHQKAEKIS